MCENGILLRFHNGCELFNVVSWRSDSLVAMEYHYTQLLMMMMNLYIYIYIMYFRNKSKKKSEALCSSNISILCSLLFFS